MKTFYGAAMLAAMVATMPASAAKYVLNYDTDSNQYKGSFRGLITTADAPLASGFYQGYDKVIALTGTYNLQNGDLESITLLDVGTFGYDDPNDNLFNPNPHYNPVTYDGLAFTAGGVNHVLYINPRTGGLNDYVDGSSTFRIKNLKIEQVDDAVPEPASWAMLLTGFAIVGGSLRYRRRAIATAFA